MTNVNERSSKTVISTGMMVPRWASVAALYCLQKSMMATPCGPSAVPTGGAGVACPAGIWILTTAATFFLAMGSCLLLNDVVADGDGVRQRPVPHAIGERCTGATLVRAWRPGANSSSTGVSRPKMLTSTLSLSWSSLISTIWPEKSANGPSLTRTVSPISYSRRGRPALGPAPLVAFGLDLQERLDLACGAAAWAWCPWPTKPVTPGRVADHVPGVVVELAAHQQVAREHLLLDDDLLAALELDDVLHGDDDLVDAALHVHRRVRASRFCLTFFS